MPATINAIPRSAVLTPLDCDIVQMSATWGRTNARKLAMIEMALPYVHMIEGAVKPGGEIHSATAVDAFKLVFAADRDGYLASSEVNDTLARLTLIAGPRDIGTSMRGLYSYRSFASDFKARFRKIVSRYREMSEQLYASGEHGLGDRTLYDPEIGTASGAGFDLAALTVLTSDDGASQWDLILESI